MVLKEAIQPNHEQLADIFSGHRSECNRKVIGIGLGREANLDWAAAGHVQAVAAFGLRFPQHLPAGGRPRGVEFVKVVRASALPIDDQKEGAIASAGDDLDNIVY